MSIFKHLDYKEAIRYVFEARKSIQPSLTYSRVAEAMNIQKAYLSKVLNQDAHLSQDQLYLFSETFSLKQQERDFLILLLERQRSGVKSRCKELDKQIGKIQRENHVTEKFIEAQKLDVSPEKIRDYYLDAYNQLVHVCLSNKEFCKDPHAFCSALGLSSNRIQKILDELVRIEVIDIGPQGIEVKKKGLHLNRSEKVFPSWRIQTRAMANQRTLQTNHEDDYNFTVFFSSEKKVRKQIQEEFFKFIEIAQKLSQDTEANEIYQLNFDFIRWL